MSHLSIVEPAAGSDFRDATSFFTPDAKAINHHDTRDILLADERVCLLATIAVTASGEPTFAAFGYGHCANTFQVFDLSEADSQRLIANKGHLVALKLTVRDTLEPIGHCGHLYSAVDVVLAFLPHNPTTAEITVMSDRTPFVVQGIYVDYHVVGKTAGDSSSLWFIDTPNTPMAIHGFRLQLTPELAGGNLENVRRTAPIPGEELCALVYRDRRFGVSIYHDQPYLVNPGLERANEHLRIRAEVNGMLKYVGKTFEWGTYPMGRHELAKLRLMPTTCDERHAMEELRKQFSADEAPMWGEGSVARSFRNAFGVYIESYTRAGMIEFAHQVYGGLRRPNPGLEDEVSLFTLMGYIRQFDDDTQAAVLMSAIVGMAAVVRETEDDDRSAFLMEQCVHWARKLNNSQLTEAIVAFIDSSLTGGHFGIQSRRGDNHPFDMVLMSAFETLACYKEHDYASAKSVTIDKLAGWARLLCDGDAKSTLRSDLNKVMHAMRD